MFNIREPGIAHSHVSRSVSPGEHREREKECSNSPLRSKEDDRHEASLKVSDVVLDCFLSCRIVSYTSSQDVQRDLISKGRKTVSFPLLYLPR